MKNRIISVLLAVFLGFGVFSASMPVVASASGGFVTEKPTYSKTNNRFTISLTAILEFASDCVNNLLDNYTKKIYTARYAYFYYMLINGDDCPYSMLNGDRFNNDYLYYYFRNYMRFPTAIVPELRSFMRAGGFDIDFEYDMIAFTANHSFGFEKLYNFCLSHETYSSEIRDIKTGFGTYGNYDNYYEFYDCLLAQFLVQYEIDGISLDVDINNRVITDVSSVAPPVVSVDDLKQEISEQNQTLTPKNRKMYKYSWRDLSNEQTDYYGDYLGRSIGKNGEFFDDKSFEDGVYIQPYFILGDVTDVATDTIATGSYYSPYQYHIYLEKTYDEDDSSDITYTWYSDALHYFVENGERLDTYTSKIVSYSTYYPYVNIGLHPNKYLYVYFYPTSTFSQFVPSSYGTKGYCPVDFNSSDFISSLYNNFYKSDNTSVFYKFSELTTYFETGVFNSGSYCIALHQTLSQFEDRVSDDTVSDYGLLFSSEPFTTTYLFDTARLPANSTVTISGDTVYDYSITDNSTGETSTIYNYVTNNYSYPENSGGNNNNSNSGSGGNVSGNITVGGQVDVGGKVDINVNINGGGNGGINGNIGDYVGDNSDIDTDLDNYLDLVPKLSKSFIDYMKDFFSWLPKEIYGLIILCFIFLLLRVIIPKR